MAVERPASVFLARLVNVLADLGYDGGTESDVWHEMAVPFALYVSAAATLFKI
jgi:hypothetical protein